MKTTLPNENVETVNGRNTFAKACLKSCQKVLAQIARAKESILAEARGRFEVREKMLRAAVNEAEALARETLYPGLIFPALATEKVQAVAAWDRHQRRVSQVAR